MSDTLRIAIGAGAVQVGEYLEQKYKEDITIDEALTLAVESIYLVSEDKTGLATSRWQLSRWIPKMRRLSDEEIDSYAEKARASSKQLPS